MSEEMIIKIFKEQFSHSDFNSTEEYEKALNEFISIYRRTESTIRDIFPMLTKNQYSIANTLEMLEKSDIKEIDVIEKNGLFILDIVGLSPTDNPMIAMGYNFTIELTSDNMSHFTDKIRQAVLDYLIESFDEKYISVCDFLIKDLSNDTLKINYYDKLRDICAKNELYHKAAVYRDVIKLF